MRKDPQPKYVIPYYAMKFVWITSQHDYHLAGLCKYLNVWHRFTTHEIEDEDGDYTKLVCHVFNLSWKEKLEWRLNKFLFEKCVGKHWTYDKGQRIVDNSPTSPFLLSLYYKLNWLLP